MCNDAHFLFSGYGKYGKEVLSRLYNTGKYEIAELACFGEINDTRDTYAPWMYYANSVNDKHPLFKTYVSDPDNQLGKWRLERTLLDFKPHILFDIRDPYMSGFAKTSPLRNFFHWAIMPTVDSAPQKTDWLDTILDADSVFTYSEYGRDVLLDETNYNINFKGIASPGVDIDTFKPVDNKPMHKKILGFDEKSNIIGTIMRNNPRKLYPDLFEAFRKFIDICYAEGNKPLADNTYLYIHCSYPDDGWEIPELLLEHEISRKTILTYICRNCDKPYCSFYRGARAVCPLCKHTTGLLPNTAKGLTKHQLSDIINSFDLYVQYADCEGFGMPAVEAASCGVPVMAVNYSAMSNIVDNTYGFKVPVQRMYNNFRTQSKRALPDNDECAKMMYDFLKKPLTLRRIAGNKARKGVVSRYTWDHTAKTLENYFDSIKLTGLQGKWDHPAIQYKPIPPMTTEAMSNREYINWLIVNVMQEPKLLNSKTALKYLEALNYGGMSIGVDLKIINRQSLYNTFASFGKAKIECEMARNGSLSLEPMDFISYAHQRKSMLS